MEDSFKVRIDKTFGTLASSSSVPSSSLSSLWSLTDEEIERREWSRDKDGPEPEARRTGFSPELPQNRMEDGSEMEKDLDDDDDLDNQKLPGESETESSNLPAKPDDFNDEEWEIKQSIGTDCTLDFEAEEDEYDRVALGKGKGGDHVYMNDVLGYGIDIDSCNVLPNSFRDVSRDPRANHVAAKFRLEEDSEAVNKVGSLQITEIDELPEEMNPKSIMKRKDGEFDLKSQKRVRFDPSCKNNSEEDNEGAENVSMDTCSAEVTVSNELSLPAQDSSSAVPDYIQNPSRYTCYTLDSLSDVDEESNHQAYMDFLKLVNRSNPVGSSQDEGYEDLPTVTFIPRKKLGGATLVRDSSDTNQSRVRIAAENTGDGEVCAMDEDEPEPSVDRKGESQKMNRRYRIKGNWESDDPIS